MTVDLLHLAALVASWLVYFIIHSLLASLPVKAWFSKHFPGYFHGYRLAYNLLAGILLVPPVWLTFSRRSVLILDWQGPAEAVSWLITVAALLGFVFSASIYDGGHFSGLTQFRQRQRAVIDREPLRISRFHRYVRHPWYFFGLLFIWSRDMDIYQLVSTLSITLYLLVGSRFEEHKLNSIYGEKYRDYCSKVPGLLPLPWRYLSKQQAESLLLKQDETKPGQYG